VIGAAADAGCGFNTTLNGRTTNTTDTTNAGKRGCNHHHHHHRQGKGERDKWQVASGKSVYWELGTEHWELWNTTNTTNTTMRGKLGAITTITTIARGHRDKVKGS
jgi:hypothetical protein